jgi:sugar/nucleoside kinase (ribokinase family)
LDIQHHTVSVRTESALLPLQQKEELEFITNIKDIEEAVNYLRSQYLIPLILITMGAGGSLGFHKNLQVERPAFLQEHTIETTGAGDTFFGSIINYVLEYGVENLSEANLAEMLTFANAAASMEETITQESLGQIFLMRMSGVFFWGGCAIGSMHIKLQQMLGEAR